MVRPPLPGNRGYGGGIVVPLCVMSLDAKPLMRFVICVVANKSSAMRLRSLAKLSFTIRRVCTDQRDVPEQRTAVQRVRDPEPSQNSSEYNVLLRRCTCGLGWLFNILSPLRSASRGVYPRVCLLCSESLSKGSRMDVALPYDCHLPCCASSCIVLPSPRVTAYLDWRAASLCLVFRSKGEGSPHGLANSRWLLAWG
jgi:hypothetical protein